MKRTRETAKDRERREKQRRGEKRRKNCKERERERERESGGSLAGTSCLPALVTSGRCDGSLSFLAPSPGSVGRCFLSARPLSLTPRSPGAGYTYGLAPLDHCSGVRWQTQQIETSNRLCVCVCVCVFILLPQPSLLMLCLAASPTALCTPQLQRKGIHYPAGRVYMGICLFAYWVFFLRNVSGDSGFSHPCTGSCLPVIKATVTGNDRSWLP